MVSNNYWLLIALLLAILVLLWLLDSGCAKETENFTVGLRNSLGCVGWFGDRLNASILPYSHDIVVRGTNYTKIEIAHMRHGYVYPTTLLNYVWDANALTYYFTLDTRQQYKGRWVLDTGNEHIRPQVFDGKTKQPIPVEELDRGLWGLDLDVQNSNF